MADVDPDLAELLRSNPNQMAALDKIADKHGQSIQVMTMPATSILPAGCIAVQWPDGTPLTIIGPTGRTMRLHPDA